MQIDSADRKILRALQEDAMRSTIELAELTGLTTTAIWHRVEKLERNGVINGYQAEIDLKKLGYEIEVSLRITLDKTKPNALDEFLRDARKLAEIIEIQTLLGQVDVRLHVAARSLEHYQLIYKEKILHMPHISEIESLLLISDIKNSRALPI